MSHLPNQEQAVTETEWPSLLIIDDDRSLCDLLQKYLGANGFRVSASHDAADGLGLALSGEFAIIVLDVMLPGGSGFDVLRQIRARSAVPVLMLTARGDEVDRVVGLEIGADDYLSKPFSPRELAARLQAILRRAGGAAHPVTPSRGEWVTVEDVTLNPCARVVRRNADSIELTGTEFTLLETLLRGAGSVMSRDELSRRVLGRECQPFDRSIDMHVSHLRKKLGPSPVHGDRIRSIRGAGYVYVTSGGA